MLSPHWSSRLYHASLPLLTQLPLAWQIKLASWGRSHFMHQLINYPTDYNYTPPAQLAQELWGLKFRTGLANSAGMFKNGEGYDLVARLGAGSYIGGTSTANPRLGNLKHGIKLPFISLPKSKVAINFLGLPNLGDDYLAKQTITNNKISDCPIGWSVMRSPDYNEQEGLQNLLQSIHAYYQHPQIDFLEINESCPNIAHGSGNIISRLEYIAKNFLPHRKRNFPVIVKLSNDLTISIAIELVTNLVKLGYDGINLGNTSTDYAGICAQLSPSEKTLFNYFSQNFGGGVSGAPLKNKSLNLCAEVANHLVHLAPNHEFHIIRSGGIDSYVDLQQSLAHGVKLNQWYTGFFNNYHIDGEQVYTQLFKSFKQNSL
jgi:dihydroorotate dehydrogenase